MLAGFQVSSFRISWFLAFLFQVSCFRISRLWCPTASVVSGSWPLEVAGSSSEVLKGCKIAVDAFGQNVYHSVGEHLVKMFITVDERLVKMSITMDERFVKNFIATFPQLNWAGQ